MHRLRAHLPPLLLWTLLVGALFGPILLGRQSLPAGDLTGQFYSFAVFQQQALRAGRLPLWSPGSYGGFPFAADIQAAAFYPLRLLLLWLAPSPLPLTLLEFEGVLHLWLAGAFVYLLLVELTGRREAGLLAAVAFGLGGYLTGYPLLQLAILETVAWLPLALWLARRAARAARPWPWLAALSLAVANSVLAGHPQTLLHGAFLTAAYYLFETWRARWRPGWVLGGGALVLALTLGASAVAWWPALHYLPQTVRDEVSYRFVQTGLPLSDYVQALVPGALTLYSAMYVGVPAFLLAVAAWWRGRATVEPWRAQVRFWTVAALLAGLLALGDDGLLFAVGYRLLPGLQLFRQQERWLSLFSLSLAILAGLGGALWLQLTLDTWRRVLHRAALTLALLLAVSAAMLTVMLGLAQGQWGWVWRWLAGAALAAGTVWLLSGQQQNRWRSVLLLLLLGADLGAVGLRAVPRVAAYNVLPEEPTAFIWDGAEPVRIDSGEVGTGNLGELYGLEDTHGVSPLRPAALDALQTLPDARWRQLLDVGYVLSATPLDDANLERVATLPVGSLWGQSAEALVYRNTAALGRAWLVYNAVAVADRAAALALLGDAAFDPATTVVLEGDAAPLGVSADAATVQVARVNPGELQLTVATAAPAYLVISEWFSDGWRATVDGQPATLRRADYELQCLALPAGNHVVRLWYAGREVRLGGLVSLLTLLVGLVLAWRWRWPVATWEPHLRLPQPLTARWAAVRQVVGRLEVWLSARRLPSAWARWLPLMLLLLGLGLRLFHLGWQELRGDEALSYTLALRPADEIVAASARLGDPHSPLPDLLLHAWMLLAGVSERAMRLPAALWGALLVPVAWGLGRVAGGRRRATLLALLAAVSEALVWAAQDVRSQYVLAVLTYGLATLLLLHLARDLPASGSSMPPRARQRRWPAWLAYALCCAVSVYAFYYAALALLGHVAYVLCCHERRRLSRPFALSVMLALALFMPWLVAAWPSLLAAGQLADPGSPRLARFIVNSVAYLTAGETWPRAWVRWLAGVTIPFALVGVKSLRRRDPALLALLLTGLLSTGLAAYLAQYLRSTYEQRYLLVVALPWWLLLLAGGEALLANARRRYRLSGAAALLALVALNVVSLGRYYTDPDCSRSAGYRQAAAYVAAQAQPGDVFVANAPDPCWDYYLRDLALPQAMAPATAAADADDIAVELQALGKTYDRLWFVPQENSQWDAQGQVWHWLEHNMLRERQAGFDELVVAAYRPDRTAAVAFKPVAAALENGITLEGYHLSVTGEPFDVIGDGPQLAPGQEIELTLAWRAVQPVATRYTVFVHAINERGELVAQHDGVPVFGTRPTDVWQPGELILDSHMLTLPSDLAAASLQLQVGMYDSESIVRVRYAAGGDACTVTTATLTPPVP